MQAWYRPPLPNASPDPANVTVTCGASGELTGSFWRQAAVADSCPVDEGRPRVVVTHWVHPEVADYLAGFCDPVLPGADQGVWPRERVAELAADASGLIVSMADSVDEAFLSGCPRLRVVSATLKGYDNFDADACARRGIWLTILPDLLTAPTAELAAGLIIGIMRRVAEADRYIRDGWFAGWRPRFYGTTLRGATTGIVGMGEVGQALAALLAPFGTRIVYHDAHRLPAAAERRLQATGLGLLDLLASCDVVVLLLPLTDATHRVIGRAALRRMRPGACLVNVGRGSVVDEEAVADALGGGWLGGYAADVFAMEDWALPGRPASIPARLLAHPRTLFTPHLGSAADAVRRQMSLQAARQVRQVLDGQRPDHAVNSPHGAAPGGPDGRPETIA
jgi:phosphonate dehydrogenase